MDRYHVIGMMSGSSMDGVDLAYCEFTRENEKWHFEIRVAETIPYPEIWITRLTQLHTQPVFAYPKTDLFYGKYLGQLVNAFIRKNHLEADLISSHGHTIFHQPEQGFTAQIGNGAAIHAETGLPVVSDFRTVDVMLGGQGAPLVPVGDRDLFGEYDACLNLGGFANISYGNEEQIKAFDICPCNVILNHVAGWMDLPFDDQGKIAASGQVDDQLLARLDALDFYNQKGARSLGKEWVNAHVWPIAKQYDHLDNPAMLATFTAHIASQIGSTINEAGINNVLVTGGGAYNDHLLALLRKVTGAKLIVPENHLVEYKEALVFAYLGILRLENRDNVLRQVTGSARNNTGGALFGTFVRLSS